MRDLATETSPATEPPISSDYGWSELTGILNSALADSGLDVRPSDSKIRLLNRLATLPFQIGRLVFLLSSIDSAKVFWRSGVLGRTDAGIEVIYNYKFRWWRGPFAVGDSIFLNSYNCRSVRARGNFVRRSVAIVLKHLHAHHNFSQEFPLNFCSIGCGSGKRSIEGILGSGLAKNNLYFELVDLNEIALGTARRNAVRAGLRNILAAHLMPMAHFLKRAPGNFHFIEMVGLADYFNELVFLKHCQEVYSGLGEHGYFLGANISSREEFDFAHKIAGWPSMFYRTKEEIGEVLRKAGFRQIWLGDCGLYTVWLAQR